MRFSSLIARNLWRRGVRTGLTVLGLGIGIAAVVALVGISLGFEKSFLKLFAAKGIDLVVVRAGVSQQLTSNLDQSLGEKIRRVPGVRDMAASLADVVSFEDANLVSVITNGWEPESLLFRGIRVLEGRGLTRQDRRAAMLGRVLALNLGKRVGEQLDVAGQTFQVVGIYESESWFENGGLIVPLAELQRMMGREGQVTGFVIAADSPDRRSVDTLKQRIEKAVSGVAAVPARDYVQGDIQIRLSKAMAWTTSAVALVLGSVGVLNTMMMAIFERTAEIGLLRALGWRRRRVLSLILGEALMLGVAGAVLGALLGFAGIRALSLVPTASNFIARDLPPVVPAVGLLLGVGLSLLGGLYPALRAARLEPTEALRHD
ncbi:MAG: ABC transporter permease [Isosphaeraceae bacterium]|nr:ABC transporter permease [Isosphaeraceae bacterium]